MPAMSAACTVRCMASLSKPLPRPLPCHVVTIARGQYRSSSSLSKGRRAWLGSSAAITFSWHARSCSGVSVRLSPHFTPRFCAAFNPHRNRSDSRAQWRRLMCLFRPSPWGSLKSEAIHDEDTETHRSRSDALYRQRGLGGEVIKLACERGRATRGPQAWYLWRTWRRSEFGQILRFALGWIMFTVRPTPVPIARLARLKPPLNQAEISTTGVS
jgi:hypothetical protein